VALRKTLASMVEAVRNECKLSSNTSRGIDHREHIVQLIKRHYEVLSEDFDWQHLQIKKDDSTARKNLAAGSRYYDFPATLNLQKIESAWVFWGSQWLPLGFGISYPEYSDRDPESDQRSDPVEKWDFYGRQAEVWPLPATDFTAANRYQIAFEGQQAVEQLTADSSRADIDDILLILAVSAEILAANDNEVSAKLKLAAYEQRFTTIRAGMSDKSRRRVGIGMSSRTRYYPRHPIYIRG
jgi:hypothetical protein